MHTYYNSKSSNCQSPLEKGCAKWLFQMLLLNRLGNALVDDANANEADIITVTLVNVINCYFGVQEATTTAPMAGKHITRQQFLLVEVIISQIVRFFALTVTKKPSLTVDNAIPN